MVNEFMVIGRRWNDTAGGKPKYSEKNFFHCYFVYQKFRTDRPGLEPGPPRLRASDKQPEPLHKFLVVFICRKLILCTNTMKIMLLNAYMLTLCTTTFNIQKI